MLTTMTNKRWMPFVAATFMVAACDAPPPPGLGGDDPTPVPIAGDAGVCSGAREGCPCDPTQPPISCYDDPAYQEDGTLICGRGTRYCRDGAWTACQSVAHYELTMAPGVEAINGGPSTCPNPCDSSCGIFNDVPDATDLATNGTDLIYNAPYSEPPGIQLVPVAVTPPLPDSDGDGVPDVADNCVGPGVVSGCPADTTYFYHDLPYNGAVEVDPFVIDIQIRTADVYFLMDTTGSMQGAIDNLKADLTTGSFATGCNNGIIGAIKCLIPNAWIGVGQYRDIPVVPYGEDGTEPGYPADFVYQNMQDLSPTPSLSQTAVNNLVAGGGYDSPEAQTQAFYSIATGYGMSGYYGNRTNCPAGTWGYPCFRDGTIPVIVHMTDERFHNGYFPVYNYGPEITSDRTYATAVGAIVNANIRIVTIFTGYVNPACFYDPAYCSEALLESLFLAYATNSVSGGFPYFYNAPNGSGLTSAAVGSIEQIAEYNRYDITAVPRDNTSDTRVDDRGFIESILPGTVTGGGGCTGTSTSGLTATHTQCAPGTDVEFIVNFRNDLVMPMTTEQVFTFTIDIMGDGDFVLQTIPIRIVVPAVIITYPNDGTYWRDYDSVGGAINCAGNERPDWGNLTFSIPILPTGTSVEWQFRSADTLSGLASATPVTATTPGVTSGLDVGAYLESQGAPNYRPYLRISAVLHASSDNLQTPRLEWFNLQYNCVPIE